KRSTPEAADEEDSAKLRRGSDFAEDAYGELCEVEDDEDPQPPQPSSSSRRGAKVSLEKLRDIRHGAHAILSVDFAPSSAAVDSRGQKAWKLITAGQDGKVKVWSVAMTQPSALPRLLVTMRHEAPVACARWSPDAMMIASCDAEATLMVWARGPGHGNVEVAAAQPGEVAEYWHRKCFLPGHEGEICDVSWHPNLHPDFTLASCSHDGTIRLWSLPAGELCTVLRLPGESAGYVKGVAFDPLGRYLATMSDGTGAASRPHATLFECPDAVGAGRSADGWRLVPLSQEPWAKPGPLMAAVNFRRPSWDPLGQSVVFPFGERKNCEISTARFYAALFAEPWKAPKLYRGHKSQISVVQFSPAVHGNSQNPENAAVVLALAGTDGVLSIWISSLPVPILVWKDLVDENCFITDLSWTPDGSVLCFSSSGGGVGALLLAFDQLPLPEGTWSLDELRLWRCRQYVQVVQPSADLPKDASALVGGSAREETAPDDMDPDEDLVATLQGLPAWDTAKASKASSAARVLDVDSCIEKRKLLKSWLAPVMPQLTALSPPRTAWFVQEDGGNGALLAYQRTLDIESIPGVDGLLCRISLREEHAAKHRASRSQLRWRVSLAKRVLCAKVQGAFVALVTSSSTDLGPWELQVLNAQTGLDFLEPVCLGNAPARLELFEAGAFLVLVETDATLSLWQLASPDTSRILLRCSIPRPFHNASDMGLIRSSLARAPYLRKGRKSAVYQADLACWMELPWRELQKRLHASEVNTPMQLDLSGLLELPMAELSAELAAQRSFPTSLPALLGVLSELGIYAAEEGLPGLLKEIQTALGEVSRSSATSEDLTGPIACLSESLRQATREHAKADGDEDGAKLVEKAASQLEAQLRSVESTLAWKADQTALEEHMRNAEMTGKIAEGKADQSSVNRALATMQKLQGQVSQLEKLVQEAQGRLQKLEMHNLPGHAQRMSDQLSKTRTQIQKLQEILAAKVDSRDLEALTTATKELQTAVALKVGPQSIQELRGALRDLQLKLDLKVDSPAVDDVRSALHKALSQVAEKADSQDLRETASSIQSLRANIDGKADFAILSELRVRIQALESALVQKTEAKDIPDVASIKDSLASKAEKRQVAEVAAAMERHQQQLHFSLENDRASLRREWEAKVEKMDLLEQNLESVLVVVEGLQQKADATPCRGELSPCRSDSPPPGPGGEALTAKTDQLEHSIRQVLHSLDSKASREELEEQLALSAELAGQHQAVATKITSLEVDLRSVLDLVKHKVDRGEIEELLSAAAEAAAEGISESLGGPAAPGSSPEPGSGGGTWKEPVATSAEELPNMDYVRMTTNGTYTSELSLEDAPTSAADKISMVGNNFSAATKSPDSTGSGHTTPRMKGSASAPSAAGLIASLTGSLTRPRSGSLGRSSGGASSSAVAGAVRAGASVYPAKGTRVSRSGWR
ncbi:hira, partial [Symbiodinium sp. CCMP2592]